MGEVPLDAWAEEEEEEEVDLHTHPWHPLCLVFCLAYPDMVAIAPFPSYNTIHRCFYNSRSKHVIQKKIKNTM